MGAGSWELRPGPAGNCSLSSGLMAAAVRGKGPERGLGSGQLPGGESAEKHAPRGPGQAGLMLGCNDLSFGSVTQPVGTQRPAAAGNRDLVPGLSCLQLCAICKGPGDPAVITARYQQHSVGRDINKHSICSGSAWSYERSEAAILQVVLRGCVWGRDLGL